MSVLLLALLACTSTNPAAPRPLDWGARVSTTASVTIVGNESDYLGIDVASAGDVNGDGYGDVAIAAEFYDDGTGGVFVHLGSASGLSPTAAVTLSEDYLGELGQEYCRQVDGAGDVDGDGYDDVIMGCPGYRGYTGHAYVYHGSASGLSAVATTDLTITDNVDFAISVAAAGDVNGDGYDDVIVGDNGTTGTEGHAYVYYGSATGVSDAPDVTLSGTGPDDGFGASVSGAGDVDGDGFDDVLVSEAYEIPGQAHLYRGSAAGLSATPAVTWEGTTGTHSSFGAKVSTAGDVDGDGFDDVMLTSQQLGIEKGFVHVYLGSPTGPSTVESHLIAVENFHEIADAGDVDGDGYDDILVGVAYTYDSSFDESFGFVRLYRGSAAGLGAAPDPQFDADLATEHFGEAVSGAGDTRGDGADDVLIGAPRYNPDASYTEGRVLLFEGEPLEDTDTDGDTDTGGSGDTDTDVPDTDTDPSDTDTGVPDTDTDAPDTDTDEPDTDTDPSDTDTGVPDTDTDVPDTDTDVPDTDTDVPDTDTDVPDTDVDTDLDGHVGGGCSCSASPSMATISPVALLIGALLMRRRSKTS